MKNYENLEKIITAATTVGWKVYAKEGSLSLVYEGEFASTLTERIEIPVYGHDFETLAHRAHRTLVGFNREAYERWAETKEMKTFPKFRSSAGRRYLRRKIRNQGEELESLTKALASSLVQHCSCLQD